MSTYVISDIHGCNQAFRTALKSVNLRKTDTLIILGDMIDRGPDSKGVLDTIFLLQEHNFDVRCLLGNHEKMLLNAVDNIDSLIQWFKNGGKKTLESFLTSDIKMIPEKYIQFLENLPLSEEYENFILVHAGLNMNIKNPFEDVHSILWLRNWEEYYNESWLNGRILIHGHTPTKESEINKMLLNNKKVLCIDNGAFIKQQEFGSICILRLDDMRIKFVKNETSNNERDRIN